MPFVSCGGFPAAIRNKKLQVILIVHINIFYLPLLILLLFYRCQLKRMEMLRSTSQPTPQVNMALIILLLVSYRGDVYS